MDDRQLIETLIAGMDALRAAMVEIPARHQETWQTACDAADRWKWINLD